jgi:hypothetical protein
MPRDFEPRLVWLGRPRRLALTILAAALFGAGCGQVAPTSSTGIPSGSVAASPSDAPSWGPLAVTAIRSRSFAGASGSLRITEECTFLDQLGDQRYLLVWPAHRTRWDAEAQRIIFQIPSGEVVQLRDGQAVRFGGGGFEVPEASGGTRPDLVVPPDPSCEASTWWYVGDVEEE